MSQKDKLSFDRYIKNAYNHSIPKLGSGKLSPINFSTSEVEILATASDRYSIRSSLTSINLLFSHLKLVETLYHVVLNSAPWSYKIKVGAFLKFPLS
jgi:hypothetical protein